MTRYDEALKAQDLLYTVKIAEMPMVYGMGMGFERTRRITGYLVGSLNRFNNAKRAEERERVKHG